jgi:uncharacterized protein YegP (UPF0339 family)
MAWRRSIIHLEGTMAYYVYQDSQGQWRWRLLAANRQIIATSGEGYVRKTDCLHAIDLVKGSGSAPVYEG